MESHQESRLGHLNNLNGKRHKEKFKRWRKRQPEKCKWLVDAVVNIIVPKIEEKGFIWVDGFQGNKLIERDTSSRDIIPFCITFHKQGVSFQDLIDISFSHRQKLHFSISFQRLSNDDIENKIVTFPNFLIRYKSPYAGVKDLGCNWFSFIATEESINRYVEKISLKLPQVFDRLETGKVGWNIAKSSRHKKGGILVKE